MTHGATSNWLTGRLTVDFKTIARFRKDNGNAVRSICGRFVVLCPRLDVFADPRVATDGSTFKAANHRDGNFKNAKSERRMQGIEASIGRYLLATDTAERQELAIAKATTERLQERIDALREQMQSRHPTGKCLFTDHIQTAVDATHHLIVAHRVTNNGIDVEQLASMATRVRMKMGVDKLTVVADRGYYRSEVISGPPGKLVRLPWDHSAPVTRITSSSDVMPDLSQRSVSSRMVRIPAARPVSSNCASDALVWISPRSASSITSNS